MYGSDPDEWWLDTRPLRIPEEHPPITPIAWFYHSGRAFGKAAAAIAEAHIALARDAWGALVASVDVACLRSPTIGQPGKGDCFREYPTSWDSWFNEYTQPIRKSQINRTRRPYRR